MGVHTRLYIREKLSKVADYGNAVQESAKPAESGVNVG